MWIMEAKAREKRCPMRLSAGDVALASCLGAECMAWLWMPLADDIGRCGLVREPYGSQSDLSAYRLAKRDEHREAERD